MRRYLASALVLGCAACLESPPDGGGDDGAPDAAASCDQIIRDPFDGDQIGPVWVPWQDDSGTLEVGGGVAVLAAGPAAPGAYSDLTSTAARPMAGTVVEARMWVDMVGLSDAALLLVNEAGDSVSFQVWGGRLWSELSGVEFCAPCAPYSNQAHIAVRMTAGTDDIRVDWSDDDGETWRSLGVGSPIPAGEMRLQVYIAAPSDVDGATLYLDEVQWLDCGVAAVAGLEETGR